jgi:hypothetical protein
MDCLAENEVFCSLSEPLVDPITLDSTSIIVGDVLVSREPCLLPTDVRKVKAVNKIELAYYKDVIIFPAKGEKALCSLLGGGCA